MGQLSPRQVALIAAITVALVAGILLGTAFWWGGQSTGLAWALVIIVLLFGVAYGAVSYGIERFVNARIKLLYRTVHELRSARNTAPRIDLKGDVIKKLG